MTHVPDVTYELPVYIELSELRPLMSRAGSELTQRQLRERFVRHGLAVKVGGRWNVATDDIRLKLPALYTRLFEKFATARSTPEQR